MKTKTFIIFGIFLATIALQGCKHPLAIEGEGDIVDANNSGHGCTLEQFRARDKACTENDVSGDYFVNYKAVPRPGWRFVRWDGPCPPDSDFQHCRHHIAKEGVDWWDETYPNNEIPPSTAVFAPITGETGYLLAGTAVAGVAWETATQQGVTGIDGSFQYEEGETVRFMIGNTLLGKVTGQAQVTPFDLAGSPIVTGIDITWALQDVPGEIDPYENVFKEDPKGIDSPVSNQGEANEKINAFHGVINMAVLLQSLDKDGDPANGIVIRSGAAALLQGFSLGVGEHWEQFQVESTLRRVVAEANRRHLFSKPHGILAPEAALENLYTALQIDPATVGVRRLQNQSDYLPSSYTEYFHYNTDGTMSQHDDGTPDAVETWQYDSRGNVIRHERDAEMYVGHDIETWQYDARGNLIRKDWDGGSSGPDGNPDMSDIWQYNADGNVVRHERNPLEEYTYGTTESWQYDARGRVIKQQWDLGSDRMYGSKQTWQYDTQGNVTRSSFYLDEDIWQISNALYNRDGKVTQVTWKGHGDRSGSNQGRRDWTYDDSGKLTRLTEHWQTEYNGPFGGVETWQYNADGNVTHWERLEEGGSRESQSWHYDGDGRLSRYECVGGCPEVTTFWLDHRIDSWQYHGNGQVLRHITEGTAQHHSEDPAMSGTWVHEYDANGRLIYYEERAFDYDNQRTNRIERWKYNPSGRLVSAIEDNNADGRPDNIENWAYDASGKLIRYQLDGDGDGSNEGSTTYQYEATGWGYLFAKSTAWRHDEPPPPKPVADPRH